MPKLLQISIEVNNGSVGTIVEQIGQIVLKNGWESYVAYGRNYSGSISNLIRIGDNFDIMFHGIQTRIFDNHGFASKTATKDLIINIENIKPDIIHLHHLHGYYINIEILFEYLKACKIPVIWTLHDCWAFTGHCAHFEYVGCEKWKSECHHCEQKSLYPKSLFIDRSRKNYLEKKKIFNSVENLTIVSVSNWLSNKVNESFLKGFDSRMIYNGIDLETFYPKESRSKIDKLLNIHGKFLLLGVAPMWESKKGFNDFIELSKLIDDTFVIVLVGLNKVQHKMLPKNIIGIERIQSQEELSDYFSGSDLFLNLSVEESFGLTTAEALACGAPSIVYNSTACPEIVSSDTGIVVEKNNMDELMHAIKRIRNLGKGHFSENCRKRAISLFDKEVRYLDYLKLYTEILNK